MPENRPLESREGDGLSAKKWNAMVDAICGPGISLGAGLGGFNNSGGHILGLLEQPNDYWVGQVVTAGPNGESDWTDNRYWIQRQQLTTANYSSPACSQQQSCSPNLPLTWQAAGVPYNQIVCATNLQESTASTHFLTVGQYVHVWEEWDAGSTDPLSSSGSSGNPGYPTIRYKFNSTPQPFIGVIQSAGPCSEADFTNNRYWVLRGTVSHSGYTGIVSSAAVSDPAINPCQYVGQECSPPSSCSLKEDGRHSIVVVTNFAEAPNSTHLLDIGATIECWWGPDGSGGLGWYTQFTPEMRIGVYCPANATGPNDSGSNDTLHQLALDFHQDDFLVSNSVAQPWRSLIQWNGFTVLDYTGFGDKACNVKILKFDSTGFYSFGAVTQSPSGSYNNYQFNVVHKVASNTASDGCAQCSSPADKPEAIVTSYILVDPCLFAASVTDGTNTYAFNEITLGTGLALTPIMSPSGCGNNVTISVNACSFLPTLTDGVTTTQVGTVNIGTGLALAQNTSTCPGTVTLTVNPCSFLPTITDGVTTTQVGTINIGSGLVLAQNTSTCPGTVTITGTSCGPICCYVSTDGGSNASSPTGVANYTYTVTDACSSATIGTGMAPTWARPQGILTGPAANGFYIVIGGSATLLTTDEQAALVTCT